MLTHAQVPKLNRLVLAIAEAVPPIPLWRHERDSLHSSDISTPLSRLSKQRETRLRMSHKRPTRSLTTQTPAIPHLDERIVAAREEEVARPFVGERDRVDVVAVRSHAQDGPIRLEVVHKDLAVTRAAHVGPGDDLGAVVGEAEGPNLWREGLALLRKKVRGWESAHAKVVAAHAGDAVGEVERLLLVVLRFPLASSPSLDLMRTHSISLISTGNKSSNPHKRGQRSSRGEPWA